MLLDPLEILLEGGEAVESVRPLVRLRSATWAAAMLGPDDGVAVESVRARASHGAHHQEPHRDRSDRAKS